VILRGEDNSSTHASARECHLSAHRPVFSRICNATSRERQIMARKPANLRARCRAHGSRKLELRTYAMYLTPFPAPDGESGYGGVRPVAQSSHTPPIAHGRRCCAKGERAPRVKQHAARSGWAGEQRRVRADAPASWQGGARHLGHGARHHRRGVHHGRVGRRL
jgi:hypothetical protein